MTNKIIYYAPTSNMGETFETDAEKYREWATKELQARFPGFEIEVSDQENITSFWTNIDSVQMSDKITMIIGNLWDYCPWNFQASRQEKDHNNCRTRGYWSDTPKEE
jgi:hypothetical protein